MRKKLFTDKAEQSWDSYSTLPGSASTLIRDNSWSAADCMMLVLHKINEDEFLVSGLFWLMNSEAENLCV